MKTSDFDYDLPPELIAQEPAAERDAAACWSRKGRSRFIPALPASGRGLGSVLVQVLSETTGLNA